MVKRPGMKDFQERHRRLVSADLHIHAPSQPRGRLIRSIYTEGNQHSSQWLRVEEGPWLLAGSDEITPPPRWVMRPDLKDLASLWPDYNQSLQLFLKCHLRMNSKYRCLWNRKHHLEAIYPWLTRGTASCRTTPAANLLSSGVGSITFQMAGNGG